MKNTLLATLWPVILIALFFTYILGCKKDNIPSNIRTELTIEEAKLFFASKIIPGHTQPVYSRGDSIETEAGRLLVPDWSNAVSYFDEVKLQSVVEVPILESSFSLDLPNPGEVDIDTGLYSHGPQNNRLIVVRDAQGITDYAIMKIAGTIQYNSSPEALFSNTYRQIDSLFEGVISYVDINDQIRQSYYGLDKKFYEIDSIGTVGVNQNVAQNRWEIICIKNFIFTRCTCQPHHYVGENCKCNLTGGTNPTITEVILCFETGLYVNIPSHNPPQPPAYNPNNPWNGGGTNNNPSQNPSICFIQNVNRFDSIYGTELLNDYEEQAQACISLGCSASFADFKRCVTDGMLSKLNEKLNLTEAQISWLTLHKNAVVQMNECIESYLNEPLLNQALLTHLNLLMTDQTYFTKNDYLHFPGIGTQAWANTVTFSEPQPNAAEIALSSIYPLQAIIINGNVEPAFNEMNARFTSSTFFENDNADAFRHAFFLARNTQMVGSSIAFLFGEAHESSTPSNLVLGRQMDMYNNGVGISYGENHPFASRNEMANFIESAVHNGEMQQILPQDWVNFQLNHGIIPGVSQLVPTN